MGRIVPIGVMMAFVTGCVKYFVCVILVKWNRILNRENLMCAHMFGMCYLKAVILTKDSLLF